MNKNVIISFTFSIQVIIATNIAETSVTIPGIVYGKVIYYSVMLRIGLDGLYQSEIVYYVVFAIFNLRR